MISCPKSRYLLEVSDSAKKEQKDPASRLACTKELQKTHIELWISLKKTWFTYQRKEGRRLANYKMESTGSSPDINSQTTPSRVKSTQVEKPSCQHRNPAHSRALTTVAPKVFRLFLIFPTSTRNWIFRCSPKIQKMIALCSQWMLTLISVMQKKSVTFIVRILKEPNLPSQFWD